MLKRIVTLLVGGFVAISMAVAFIPSITGIVTSGLSGATKAVIDVALWLIPLGVGFLIVMMGVRVFSKPTNSHYASDTFKGGSRRMKRWSASWQMRSRSQRSYRNSRRAARSRGMALSRLLSS